MLHYDPRNGREGRAPLANYEHLGQTPPGGDLKGSEQREALAAPDFSSCCVVRDIFQEDIKGLKILIQRAIGGDILQITAGQTILLDILATEASARDPKQDSMQKLADKGVTIDNYQVGARIYDGILHLTMQMHPYRFPRSVGDAFKLAASWVAAITNLPGPFFKIERKFVSDGSLFTTVRYPGSLFTLEREVVLNS